MQVEVGRHVDEAEFDEEEPLTVAELTLDLLCRLESPDDLVEFIGQTSNLLNRCARVVT